MQTLISERVWNAVAPLLDGRSGEVWAAFGYVGVDAPKILPLGAKDTLVFDGSDANVVAGVVNPDAVAAFLEAGCRCFTLSGLHAKMLVSSDPPIAIVGSANLSGNSRDHLAEAAIRTDEPDILDAVEDQIRLWRREGTPVDGTWLKHARTLYRPPRADSPRRGPGSEPRDAPMWVMTESPTSRVPPDEVAAAKTAAWQRLPRGFDTVTSLELSHGDDKVVREGDVMVLVWTPEDDDAPHGNRRVEPWAVVDAVVPAEPSNDRPPYAVLVSDSTAPRPSVKAVRDVFKRHGMTVDWSGDAPYDKGGLTNDLWDLLIRSGE